MKTLIRAAGFAALLMASSAGAALAQPEPAAAEAPYRATTLNLSAYGEVRLAPDMATISLGVTAEAPTAAEALRANAVRMNAVIDALKRGGIAPRDIQTSGLSLNPQYVYVENQPPKLTGYQVSNQVTVTVRDLTRLGGAVDAVVGAGATNVGGISFGLQNPAAAEDQARLDAVKALIAKSELYGRATGYRVVRLVALQEGGGYTPPVPVPVMAFARREAADSTPVEGGEVKIRIDISGVYELGR
jgi:uncharacterized protein YggE